MFKGTVLCLPRSIAVKSAGEILASLGIPVTDKCAPDVTHVLLSVPSFAAGDGYLAHILSKLNDGVIISGGNLNSSLLAGYRCIDFLRDPYYLADNAAITAECAIRMVRSAIGPDLSGKKILIIGWGRIGKCLMQKSVQAQSLVTVAARRSSDLAMIHGLGCRSIHTADVSQETMYYDVIINTVPELILPDIQVKPDAYVLELASTPGMTGNNIVNGRGLPGKMAPEQSGKLIAETFIRLSIS